MKHLCRELAEISRNSHQEIWKWYLKEVTLGKVYKKSNFSIDFDLKRAQ